MLGTRTTFTNDDLVLNVRSDYDPAHLRLDDYEPFLDALCGDREYQKDAIRAACRLLAGREYANTRELAEENFASNPILGQRYESLDGLISSLPFPTKLSGSVDLATGTGKSYVMYGIARILLAAGVVDKVLVLCPSLTIEAGLQGKFKALTGDPTMRDVTPTDAVYRVPEITDATRTTQPGEICIENIDATYRHVRSSVRDSFRGQGERTLVLNDEAHHIFSPSGARSIRRWKEFLDNDEFGFTRVLGFSGTCYTGNDYFPDVIARYSLRTAMEDGVVKQVRYVARDESVNQAERFQKYQDLHTENQQRHRSLKPLSIVVTHRISGAEALAREFTQFLAEAEGVDLAEAERRVIVVTSSADHRAGVEQLPYVDQRESPVEWIFSVSMLTEGWDVKNVFQIVPHEKRAFGSKLLIAQVLGRGLRVPDGIAAPAVWVFNHASWSNEISGLVSEVLEQERRLSMYPVSDAARDPYHLELHHLTYETRTVEQELRPRNGNGEVQLFTRGYINFESQPVELERTTVFHGAIDGREYVHRTAVRYAAYDVDEVVRRLRARLRSIDQEAGTRYLSEYPAHLIRTVIEESLKRIGETRGLVSEQNLQHAYRAMGNTQRRAAKAVRVELEPGQLFTVDTRNMRSRSIGLQQLMRDATIFYDSVSPSLSEDQDGRALAEVSGEDTWYPRRNVVRIDNRHWFRTPVNVVLTTHEPERSFVRRLFDPAVSERLAAWVKTPDVGFYEIGYSWRKGDHTKQGRFNPDLFIKLADRDDVLVIELKGDDDDTAENRAKLRFASEHFGRINALQGDLRYHFQFMSPRSYDGFFQELTAGDTTSFVSSLQASLSE
jgi:type III restriction enzyme